MKQTSHGTRPSTDIRATLALPAVRCASINEALTDPRIFHTDSGTERAEMCLTIQRSRQSVIEGATALANKALTSSSTTCHEMFLSDPFGMCYL